MGLRGSRISASCAATPSPTLPGQPGPRGGVFATVLSFDRDGGDSESPTIPVAKKPAMPLYVADTRMVALQIRLRLVCAQCPATQIRLRRRVSTFIIPLRRPWPLSYVVASILALRVVIRGASGTNDELLASASRAYLYTAACRRQETSFVMFLLIYCMLL